ncbi:hypothetical protein CJ030_MR7G023686 [Morella rubra]|uniref:Cotton fiber protein n=1 Tax=Morella rubra TaxID=262757 RepID=A0A6A1UZN0_9ROSI|nr:hypothetical protein CJ030_MR7G023686 [Morella rubra]
MPRKRLPILQKASNLFKFPIFVARIRKPIIPKLMFLRKSRRVKKCKLLKHYNFGFLDEYQFSPSSTPLIHYRRKNIKSRNLRDIYSMFLLCRCLRGSSAGGGDSDYTLGALPAFPATAEQFMEPLGSGDEEDSVDQRAERFIQRFYEQMKMQRQESI